MKSLVTSRACSVSFVMPVEVLESDSVQNFKQRFAVFVLKSCAGEHQSFRLDDFVKDALHRVDRAVGSTHVDPNQPAGTRVQFAHGIGELRVAPTTAPPCLGSVHALKTKLRGAP